MAFIFLSVRESMLSSNSIFFVTAAHVTIRYSKRMKAKYLGLVRRLGKNRAIVAIARILLECIYVMLTKNIEFEDNIDSLTERKMKAMSLNFLAIYFPDRAIPIWKRVVDEEISKTNARSYEVAVSHISEFEKLMGEVRRMPEWVSYVSQLREDNKKRPRFLSTLDRINRKKIMDP